MNITEIAQKLKELGARALGGNVWEKASQTAMYASVQAQVVQNPLPTGVVLSSLKLPLNDKEFVSVKLGKGVPTNKATYDIYEMRAVKDWAPRPGQKGDPIKVGDRTFHAF